MKKQYKHLVMFGSLVEAFEYQNENGGELFINRVQDGDRYSYYEACVIDKVTFADIKQYPILVAEEGLVTCTQDKRKPYNP